MQKGAKIEVFIENLKTIYRDKSTQVIQGLQNAKPTSFRLNSLVEGPDPLLELKELGVETIKGPFPDTFYIKSNKNDIHISDTEAFKTGAIYVQEFSSMIPPIVMEPSEEDKLLDMSAAPGSKTTQLASLTHNKAEIMAIEKHPIRILTLKHNLELQKATNVNVMLADGIKFDKRYSQFVEFFDKVLVDAPCSSEGRFLLNDKRTYKYWNVYKRKEMSSIQKGLLISGFRMLKPGGTLVYSTCTFGVEENEMVLEWFLDKVGEEAKIEKIDLPIKNTMPGLSSYEKNKFDKSIANSLRIIPNDFFTGFFVAKIKKK